MTVDKTVIAILGAVLAAVITLAAVLWDNIIEIAVDHEQRITTLEATE